MPDHPLRTEPVAPTVGSPGSETWGAPLRRWGLKDKDSVVVAAGPYRAARSVHQGPAVTAGGVRCCAAIASDRSAVLCAANGSVMRLVPRGRQFPAADCLGTLSSSPATPPANSARRDAMTEVCMRCQGPGFIDAAFASPAVISKAGSTVLPTRTRSVAAPIPLDHQTLDSLHR